MTSPAGFMVYAKLIRKLNKVKNFLPSTLFAVKMRLRDFLKIVEIPTLFISNICKMALGSNIRFRVIDGLQ